VSLEQELRRLLSPRLGLGYAAFLEGLVVGARASEVLSAGVDGGETFEGGEIASPEWNEAPAHLYELALIGVAVLPDDRLHRGGRDVVVPRGRREVIDLRGVEGFGDLLLVTFAVIASTHGERVSLHRTEAKLLLCQKQRSTQTVRLQGVGPNIGIWKISTSKLSWS
jgi:hypothetical protein